MANEVQEPALKYNYIPRAAYLPAGRAAAEKHRYNDGQVLAVLGRRIES